MAQKPAKNVQKGAPGVEGAAANTTNVSAISADSSPSGGQAAAQAAPMSITLGGGAAQPRARQTGSQDAVMEGQPDPLANAARNDGPRQSLTGGINNVSGQTVESLDVNGEIPQARFGHTITIVSKAKVVLFGGATGDTGKYSMTGETFMYNILNKAWQKLTVKGVPPSPRAAHSATNVEQMQMVVYGGATGGGSLASDDLYLLDMRNGEDMAQWMIVPVVGSTPGRRYGHSIIFSKPHLLVYGGNTGAEPVNDVWCLSVERAPFSWNKLDCGRDQPSPRVYHSAALCQTGSATGMMVCFGGRTTDQTSLSDTWGLRRHRDGRWDWVKAPYKAGEAPTPRYQHSTLFLGPLMMVIGGRTNQVGEDVALEVYDTESSEWYKFRAIQRFRTAVWSIDTSVFVHGGFEHETPNIPINSISRIDATKLFANHPGLAAKIFPKTSKSGKDAGPKNAIRKNQNIYNIIETQEFRLANQAHIAMSLNPQGGQMEAPAEDFSLMVRQISIDKLQEEPRKLGPNVKAPLIQKNHNESLYSLFIKDLLAPREGQAAIPAMRPFHIKKEQVLELINEVTQVFQAQPMLIKALKPPIKIFGNLHGNYNDLMRFFDIWRAPQETGDICSFDYVFLGNYVDRGSQSLEVLCLLIALKLKYPRQIFLLRGNHEDRNVNKYLGFGQECAQRFNENIDDPNSVFQKFNDLFEWMPLGAVIQDKMTQNRILCIHGGIGNSIVKLEDIDKIQRPLRVNLGNITDTVQQMSMDIMWSDPTASDEILGMQSNTLRDPQKQNNIMCYGPDIVDKFLKQNQISMIVRSHQNPLDAIDKFSANQLITISSTTNYCGTTQNNACMLLIQKKLVISPKIIQPVAGCTPWQQIPPETEGENSAVRGTPTPPRERTTPAQ